MVPTLSLAFALLAPAVPDVRLGAEVRPLREALHLRLDPARGDYTGTARIDLEVVAASPRVRFHAQDMELSGLVLRGAEGEVPVTSAVDARGVVTLTAAAPLPRGLYALEMGFHQEFGTQAVALYKVVKDGVPYAFTQFEPDDAREAFPCFDEPAFKIPYDVTVLVPAGQLAVANAPAVSDVTADGWRRLEFARTPPLPSYALAIAAGPFETVDIPGLSVPGRVVVPRGGAGLTGLAVEMAPGLLAAAEAYHEQGYPFAKLDLIAVPEFWPGAMENPGAITFAERVLLVDPQEAGVEERRDLARIMAHEFSHMWFGDLVTMAWWDDLWLNESFGEFMGDKLAAQVHPELDIALAEMGGIGRVQEQDARPSIAPIQRPVLTAENVLQDVGLAYDKGRAVLAMVEAWIGPEAFRRGVNRHLAAHAWGSARSADLWEALGDASGQDVEALLGPFVRQPGYPLVTLERLPGGRVRLSQRRFANAGVEVPPLTWKVPVVLRLPGGRTERVLLGAEPVVLSLGAEPAWILPAADGVGYYRWSLPSDLLRALAKSSAALTPAERIALLANLGGLLDAGEIGGDAYLDTLGILAGDSHPQVAAACLAALDRVRAAFVPDALRPAFASYVRRVLAPARERFGLEARAGETPAAAALRGDLLLWLGRAGDPAAREVAGRVAAAVLEGGSRSITASPGHWVFTVASTPPVDPALAGPALQVVAADGDRALFDRLTAGFADAATPGERNHLLGAISGMDDPALQDAALAWSLSGPLRPQEILNVSIGVAGTEAGADRAFRWMRASYPEIASRIPPFTMPFLPYFGSGCSTARMAEVRAFFGDPAHAVPGTAQTLERVADQVKDCVARRQREGAAVAGYLAGAG